MSDVSFPMIKELEYNISVDNGTDKCEYKIYPFESIYYNVEC